jgi:protein-glutamine gamma-glutamyltransferase
MVRLPITLAAALAISFLFGVFSPALAQAPEGQTPAAQTPAAQTPAKTPTRPDLDPADITPLSDWYGLYLQGKKMGYFHIVREKKNEVVHEGFTLVMRLVSFNKKVEMTMAQTLRFSAKPPFKLLGGDFTQKDGMTTLKLKLEGKGEGFELTHEAGGVKQTKKHGPIDYTLADSMAAELWVRRGPKVGDELTHKDFDLQELKLDKQHSKVKAVKNSLAGGVKVRYFEIESESERQMLQILSRNDDQGRMLSGQFAIFEMRLEPEQEAKNAAYSQDLFVQGQVKIDRPLGYTGDVRELIVEVKGIAGKTFENGPRQRVETGDEPGTAILKLGKKHGIQAKATDEEIKENLEETLAYPISHPRIKKLAEEAVGDAQTPREKVKRIVSFVKDYIRPYLSASLPNIHDLCDKKKGDCKSYALLFNTLARASGIPAREVNGLLYIGDDQKAFGGHAWNEVVLDGVWVPIDASMRQTEVDATHVSFGSQDRAAKNLLTTLGKLSFRLIEVQTK